jgi:hypothetical protein
MGEAPKRILAMRRPGPNGVFQNFQGRPKASFSLDWTYPRDRISSPKPTTKR